MQYIDLWWSALCSSGSWLVCISGDSSLFLAANMWQFTQMFPIVLVPKQFSSAGIMGEVVLKVWALCTVWMSPVCTFWSREHVAKSLSPGAVRAFVPLIGNSNFHLSVILLYFHVFWKFLCLLILQPSEPVT